VALTVAILATVVGCSGSSLDSSCDVEGIQHEVEHMVGESNLTVRSLDSLRCAQEWAIARATVTGDGQADQTSTFLFQRTDSGWFLKSPEISCGADPGQPTVPEELKAEACAGT
jgi:hypothetical protein